MVLRKIITVCVILCSTMLQVKAQSNEIPVKEFAIRLSSLSSIDFVYKHERKPDRIGRLRIMFSQIALSGNNNNTNTSLNTGIAYGLEKRKDLGNSTYFMHGWEPFAVVNLSTANKNTAGQITAGVGYLLGFGHNFSQGFAMGLEIIPNLYTNYNLNTQVKLQGIKINSSFSATSVAISFVHRIQ